MASKTAIQWKVYHRLASQKRWSLYAIYETRSRARETMQLLRWADPRTITKAVKYVRGGGR